MGAMKRNKINVRNKRDIISKITLLVILTIAFITISTCNKALVVSGKYVMKEHNSILLDDGESGFILYIHDDIAFIVIQNASQVIEDTSSLHLINVQQPENPVRLGIYDIAIHYRIPKLIVNDNIAYLLREKSHSGNYNWTVTLLNIDNLQVPAFLGETLLENKTIPSDFTLYNDYLYVSTNSSLDIFDCSNPSSPVKAANYSLPTGYVHINNDFLYIVSDFVKIYDLANPINPIFLGEVNSTKHTLAGSGLYKNNIISAFWWSGLQSYNCTEPSTPTIIGNYGFPADETEPGGQIHDMEIQGDRLFAGGRKLFVFDISNPQKLQRIAVKYIGSRDTYGISVSGNYIFANIHNNIKVYYFSESFLERNLGLGIGIGITVLIGGSLTLLRKKKK